ncbi:MAG: hypothetical protein DRO40_05210 [Thermoprotei archaeon]|nr:MAG: hypothetical protein DRO40_05210 [Thermoprotei archaeon]
MSKVIQVKYEGGVLKPLNRIDARKGEIFYVRILRRGLAEEIWLITFR